MKLVIGSDHAGFPLKAPVIELLRTWGHTVNDVGTYSAAPVDFPDIAKKVCGEILSGRAVRGIMVCGTGVGAAIAGNKIRGIRAALCHDTFCAHQCVEHDDVNLLCLGGWIVGIKLAEEIPFHIVFRAAPGGSACLPVKNQTDHSSEAAMDYTPRPYSGAGAIRP